MQRNGTRQIVLGVVLGTAMALLFAGRAHAQPNPQATEEFHHTVPMAANGTVDVAVVIGSIRVAGWDRNEVRVDAVKRGSSKERVAAVKINVNTSGNGIQIEAKYPERRNWFGFTTADESYYNGNDAVVTDYTLTVPRKARLTQIRTLRGDIVVAGIEGGISGGAMNGVITAKNVAGQVHLQAMNGNEEISLVRLDGDVEIECMRGDVRVTVPSDSNADLRIEALNGRIQSDFGAPSTEPGPPHLAAHVGQGGPSLNVRAFGGNVELRRANDGKRPSAITAASNVRDHWQPTPPRPPVPPRPRQ
jgi:hypothetical protein